MDGDWVSLRYQLDTAESHLYLTITSRSISGFCRGAWSTRYASSIWNPFINYMTLNFKQFTRPTRLLKQQFRKGLSMLQEKKISRDRRAKWRNFAFTRNMGPWDEKEIMSLREGKSKVIWELVSMIHRGYDVRDDTILGKLRCLWAWLSINDCQFSSFPTGHNFSSWIRKCSTSRARCWCLDYWRSKHQPEGDSWWLQPLVGFRHSGIVSH